MECRRGETGTPFTKLREDGRERWSGIALAKLVMGWNLCEGGHRSSVQSTVIAPVLLFHPPQLKMFDVHTSGFTHMRITVALDQSGLFAQMNSSSGIGSKTGLSPDALSISV